MMNLILSVIFACSAVLNPSANLSDWQNLDSALTQLQIVAETKIASYNIDNPQTYVAPTSSSNSSTDSQLEQNTVIASQPPAQIEPPTLSAPIFTLTEDGYDVVTWSVSPSAQTQFYLCNSGSNKQTDNTIGTNCYLQEQQTGSNFSLALSEYNAPMFYAISATLNGITVVKKGQLPQ